jgi:hypothetical protein
MKSFKQHLYEEQKITKKVLDQLEFYIDKLFSVLNIDVEFTKHFLDRVNDPRNVKQITPKELAKLFKDTYRKHGKKIPKLGPDAQAVLNDIQTDINMPFVLKWDSNNNEFDLVAKTIMRKKNFTTPNLKLTV